MGSTRIRGNKLLMKIDGVDYMGDATSLTLESEDADSDVVTFEDAAAGTGAQFKLKGTAIQSTDADSLWSQAWDHSGDEVPFVFAPHGNATPSPAQPHFTGTVRIGRKPTIGGEASRSTTAAYTFEFEWDVIGEPQKVTTVTASTKA